MKKLTGHTKAQFYYKNEDELLKKLRWWVTDRLKVEEQSISNLNTQELMELVEVSGTRNFLTKNRWWTISQTKEEILDEPIVRLFDDGDEDCIGFYFAIHSDKQFSLYDALSNSVLNDLK